MIGNKDVYTCKLVENLSIKADVYSVNDGKTHPVIMWLHGGALIWGSRKNIPPGQIEFYLNAGFTVVSVDYRLAPETRLEDIVEDVKDAYHWIRIEGPDLFHGDANRISIVGHSAGGYLALMLGWCVQPLPGALVSFYGYGDISGTWYSQPDEFYCRQPLVSKDEAYQTVGSTALSSAPNPSDRQQFYLYCRQNGLWTREVTGNDPETEGVYGTSFCPVRNVTGTFPKTLLLHGTADTDVPYEQSVMMAEQLSRVNKLHEFISIPGGGHMFDLAGMEDPQVANALNAVTAFLKDVPQE